MLMEPQKVVTLQAAGWTIPLSLRAEEELRVYNTSTAGTGAVPGRLCPLAHRWQRLPPSAPFVMTPRRST